MLPDLPDASVGRDVELESDPPPERGIPFEPRRIAALERRQARLEGVLKRGRHRVRNGFRIFCRARVRQNGVSWVQVHGHVDLDAASGRGGEGQRSEPTGHASGHFVVAELRREESCVGNVPGTPDRHVNGRLPGELRRRTEAFLIAEPQRPVAAVPRLREHGELRQLALLRRLRGKTSFAHVDVDLHSRGDVKSPAVRRAVGIRRAADVPARERFVLDRGLHRAFRPRASPVKEGTLRRDGARALAGSGVERPTLRTVLRGCEPRAEERRDAEQGEAPGERDRAMHGAGRV